MDSMIKEINENLKAIVDTIKSNLDNSISTLDNIQIQMDKKVEEAKKYKIQVDSAKEKIKSLEEENKSLELSLNELSDKYGKMNLVSVVEAGNREIKNKINDNLKEINKEKEHIAELTNKARTIKDLLINLKKDKTVKESRLENTKVVYDYYNERINEIIDYAFNHSENLDDYKSKTVYNYELEESADENTVDLENTMVFDEIANIDENRNFKDEMTFINDQIDNAILNNVNNSIVDNIINKSLDEKIGEDEDIPVVEESIDSTQVFDTILNDELDIDEESDESSDTDLSLNIENMETEDIEEDIIKLNDIAPVEINEGIINTEEEIVQDDMLVKGSEEVDDLSIDETLVVDDNLTNEPELNIDNNIFKNLDVVEEEKIKDDKLVEEETEMRINKINDLFAGFENDTVSLEKIEPIEISGVEEKIDNAYMDIFGKPLEEDDLNKKEPTLTDIFGNPINNDELSNETKLGKKVEELFVENGIDFNKFREDEKNYLKQIYNEEKFNNILNTLKRNKINLDNVYNAFNIFGEISANELESLISKLLNVGQSVEAIGLILEKLPKVKKYNLDEAIISYGDYVKNIDITELIMKAKELYKNGGNN